MARRQAVRIQAATSCRRLGNLLSTKSSAGEAANSGAGDQHHDAAPRPRKGALVGIARGEGRSIAGYRYHDRDD
jgi:hypothetical protein